MSGGIGAQAFTSQGETLELQIHEDGTSAVLISDNSNSKLIGLLKSLLGQDFRIDPHVQHDSPNRLQLRSPQVVCDCHI